MLSGRPAAAPLLNGNRNRCYKILCPSHLAPFHTHRASHCIQISSSASSTAQAAPTNIAPPPAIPQDPPQQQQRTNNSSTRSKRPPRPKPYLVRIAGRTSDVKAASGAVVKRLRTEDMVRVAAIDEDSLTKAVITLTAANYMAQQNSGHMLVFQPTVITAAAAEPPRIPKGSMVMYTTQIMQGEIMTFNTLRVTASTAAMALSKAVIARIATSSHTVLECYGLAAMTIAVKAIAQARKGLLVKGQDIACIITSTSRSVDSSTDAATAGSKSSPEEPVADGRAASDGGSSSSGSSSSQRVTSHRLVLLECQPRNPRALLVRSTVGVSDRPAATHQAPAERAAAGGASPPAE